MLNWIVYNRFNSWLHEMRGVRMHILRTVAPGMLMLALVACPGPEGPPKPPATATATLTSNAAVTVNWTPSVGATEYVIERKTANSAYQQVGVVSQPPFNQADLEMLQTYTYQVKAGNANGRSSGTETAAFTPDGITGIVSLGPGVTSVPRLAPQGLGMPTPTTKAPSQPMWDLPRIPGEVLVVDQSATNLRTSSSQAGLKNLQVQSVSDQVSVVRVPQGQSDESFASQLENTLGVTVQPNYLYTLQAAPTDPQYATQQNAYLSQVDMPAAWDIQTSVTNGLIAVIDSGAKFNHDDLSGRLLKGKDYCATVNASNACTSTDNEPDDYDNADGGHGTQVAGIIAANTNNAKGIAGITWSGQIRVFKIFAPSSDGTFSVGATSANLAAAIKDAADAGAKVISMSLGVGPVNYVSTNPATCFDYTTNPNFKTAFGDAVVNQAIDYADSKDVLMIAAAGNYRACVLDSDQVVMYPASNPKVLAVGSVNASNAVSSFSALGPELDMVAPGENIRSTTVFGTASYGSFTGTSESAPIVAGVAGLIRTKRPNFTALQTRQMLETTTVDLGTTGKDNTFGLGLLKAGAALVKAANITGDRLVDVFAYRLKVGADPTKPESYDANDPKSRQVSVFIPNGSQFSAYTVPASSFSTPLEVGSYRVFACVDENKNQQSCDPGDLASASQLNVQYKGERLELPSLVLTPVP